MGENMFWLLTYDYFKKDVNKPEDSSIILVHWLLLKNDFQLLGQGNEVNISLLYLFYYNVRKVYY
jgi:hypothetical protein